VLFRTQPVCLCLFSLLFCLQAPARAAQYRLAGTYHCVTIQAGKQALPCRGLPLVLHRDGTYRLWTELGTYRILGRYLVLSESKKRGPGQFHGRREISFEYYQRGVRHTVIFRREGLSPGWNLA